MNCQSGDTAVPIHIIGAGPLKIDITFIAENQEPDFS
jgi:hypothetical protein